jgi:hypothetical protein
MLKELTPVGASPQVLTHSLFLSVDKVSIANCFNKSMDPPPTTPTPIKKPAAKPTGKENGVNEGDAVKGKKSYKKRKIVCKLKGRKERKDYCPSCSREGCLWLKFRETLVEKGETMDRLVAGAYQYVVSEENKRVRKSVHDLFRQLSCWPSNKNPPDCVYNQTKRLWPSEKYSDGTTYEENPAMWKNRDGEPEFTP